MNFLKRLLNLVAALALFVALATAWGIGLMTFSPWQSADKGWQPYQPILVTDSAGKTTAMRWDQYLGARKRDPQMVPWPTSARGRMEVPRPGEHVPQVVTWSSVANKPWRFEVVSDQRDRISEVRYRLDGETPVLVATRERGPEIAFMAIPLALATLLVWKIFRWLRRRQAEKIPNL